MRLFEAGVRRTAVQRDSPKEHRTQPEKSTRLLKKGIQNLGSLEIRHEKYTFLFKFDLAGQMQSGFLKTNMKVLHQKKLKRHRNE